MQPKRIMTTCCIGKFKVALGIYRLHQLHCFNFKKLNLPESNLPICQFAPMHQVFSNCILANFKSFKFEILILSFNYDDYDEDRGASGMYWTCMHQACIGHASGMQRVGIGHALCLRWACVGHALDMCLACIGHFQFHRGNFEILKLIYIFYYLVFINQISGCQF